MDILVKDFSLDTQFSIVLYHQVFSYLRLRSDGPKLWEGTVNGHIELETRSGHFVPTTVTDKVFQ